MRGDNVSHPAHDGLPSEGARWILSHSRFSGVVVSISKWYSPPNVCPHQPTINTMHGQSGQARAQDWEPVYTHTMTVSPSWLRSLESRINEILLRCWQQSASWPRSYWRKIMKVAPISEGPGCWWLRRQIVLVSCLGCQAAAGWNDSRSGY